MLSPSQARIKQLKLLIAINHCFETFYPSPYIWLYSFDWVKIVDGRHLYLDGNIILTQCEGSNWDLFSNQDLFKKGLLSLTLENHEHPIDSHCKNFDSLILSCHTWNIPKKYPSWIFTACRSDLDTSWVCFMCDNSELSCWNFYNGSQWGVYDFPMVEIGDFFWINPDLKINPNSIPHTDLFNFNHRTVKLGCWYRAVAQMTPYLCDLIRLKGHK